MFIRVVDEGLERMLRARLPLPEDMGEVTFDTPSSAWSAQVSRLTVNLFLYEIGRSSDPARSPVQRVVTNGARERRVPLPVMQLRYLVSAWAGSVRDEHQLLGDVIGVVSGMSVLPAEFLGGDVASSVTLSMDTDPDNRPREIWGAVGGSLKASFTLQVSVAADAFAWHAAAPSVERIAALVAHMPNS